MRFVLERYKLYNSPTIPHISEKTMESVDEEREQDRWDRKTREVRYGGELRCEKSGPEEDSQREKTGRKRLEEVL